MRRRRLVLPHLLCSDLLRSAGDSCRPSPAEEAARLVPDSGATHRARASLQKTGQAERARSELETALRLEPDNPFSHRLAEDIHLEQKSNAAEGEYRRALALDAVERTRSTISRLRSRDRARRKRLLAFKSAVLSTQPSVCRRSTSGGSWEWACRTGRLGLLGPTSGSWSRRSVVAAARLRDRAASAAAAQDFMIAAVGALLVAAGAVLFWVIQGDVSPRRSDPGSTPCSGSRRPQGRATLSCGTESGQASSPRPLEQRHDRAAGIPRAGRGAAAPVQPEVQAGDDENL